MGESEPITLTERERAMFARIARHLYRAANELAPDERDVHAAMFQVGQVFERMWRKDAAAESASPPRAPGASAQARAVGVESGPGQPTEYERGRRAGIEAAAQAANLVDFLPIGHTATAGCHARDQQMRVSIIAAIRALADEPAQPSWQPTHRHYKGGEYRVLHRAAYLSEDDKMAPHVVYQARDGAIWVRPQAMFDEPGRFTEIAQRTGGEPT